MAKYARAPRTTVRTAPPPATILWFARHRGGSVPVARYHAGHH
jgi:hypothetical protein